MDPNIYKILEYLSDVPVGTKKDISPILNELFPFDKYPAESGDIIRFIDSLVSITDYRRTPYRREQNFGFIGFQISITSAGLFQFKEEQDRVLQSKAHASTINVNDSITATNKSIANINKRMLEHASAQEKIMLMQANFSEQQVGIMNQQTTLITTQTNVYRYTLILTGVSVLLTILLLIITIKSNSEKELISTQRMQLRDRDTEIKRLQFLKSDTVHYVLHYPLSKNKGIKKP